MLRLVLENEEQSVQATSFVNALATKMTCCAWQNVQLQKTMHSPQTSKRPKTNTCQTTTTKVDNQIFDFFFESGSCSLAQAITLFAAIFLP